MIIKFGCEDDVKTIMQHPTTSIISDSLPTTGGCHPRVYGTFPRVLGKYAREEGVISMEDAVRKMTSLPARRMGLQDRGQIREGMWADLVVFDPATVRDGATFEQPRLLPVGIHYVFVNGELVARDNELTGRLPGAVLRKA